MGLRFYLGTLSLRFWGWAYDNLNALCSRPWPMESGSAIYATG